MANKKYHQLDNKQWVLETRQKMSRKAMAEMYSLPSGSIAFTERAFTAEQRKTMVFERVHKSKLESKTGQQGA